MSRSLLLLRTIAVLVVAGATIGASVSPVRADGERFPSRRDRDAAPPAKPRTPVRPGPDGRMPAPQRIDRSGSWAIVLGTFSGDGHLQTASTTRDRLVERMPEFREAYVRSNTSGSAVLWGHFDGPNDPAAQTELKRVQAIVYRGARPFARAMLTRFDVSAAGPIGPLDLRNLRQRYPEVDPLYTLQVAVWADFDGTISLEEVRRSAEQYAAQLRSQRYEAFYHHDDDLKMSVVTIGAFDSSAYDPRSTLYSPDLERLMRAFPAHLVNGQPMMLLANPRDPKSPEYPQPPSLVLVPN